MNDSHFEPDGEVSGKEAYELRRQKKQETRAMEKKRSTGRRISERAGLLLRYGAAGAAVLAVISGIFWLVPSRSKLPPITMEGHIEASPPSHILDTPMPESIQKHMLEHADGAGAPGVIIQYNCEDFACDAGLVDALSAVIERYPDHVYLAPGRYDGKIILTRLGERKILDVFDEEAIISFVK